MDWRRTGREFLRIRWGFCKIPHYPLRQAEKQAAKLVTWNGDSRRERRVQDLNHEESMEYRQECPYDAVGTATGSRGKIK